MHRAPVGSWIAAVGLLALTLTCASCKTGDTLCYPDSVPTDKTDDCPYGPPGGPKVQEAACQDIPQSTSDCTTSWADVYAKAFDGPSPMGSCTLGGCHGDKAKASFGVYLPAGDAATAYASLTAYKGSMGYAYVNAEQPKHSWILCNLEGVAGGGYPMPKPSGLVDPSVYKIVAEWARCGMPGPGAIVDGGAGGAGGAGGGGP